MPLEAKHTSPKKRLAAAKVEIPEGWTTVEKVRKAELTKGLKDTYWKSPDGKKTCRSPAEVEAYVKSLSVD